MSKDTEAVLKLFNKIQYLTVLVREQGVDLISENDFRSLKVITERLDYIRKGKNYYDSRVFKKFLSGEGAEGE